MDFKLKFSASDPNGVAAIGTQIAQDLDGKKILKKYWTTTLKKDPEGKYEMLGGLIVHVPPGKPLQLSVFELCAKDGLGNEGCSTPRFAN